MLEKPDIRQSAGSSHPLSTPATWKLVPVEPTPDMLDAITAWAKFPVNAYAAMLSASPSPEALPASGVDVDTVLSTLNRMVTDYLAPDTYKARFPSSPVPWHSDFPMPDKHHSEVGADQANRRRDQAFIRDVIHLQDNPLGIKPREPDALTSARAPAPSGSGVRVADLIDWALTALSDGNAKQAEKLMLDALRASLASDASPRGEAVAKRWLVEETLPGGSIVWSCFEHEHMARQMAANKRRHGDEVVTLTPLYAHPAPATVESEALRALYEWYDRDGSVGGASEVFEQHRAALAPATEGRKG